MLLFITTYLTFLHCLSRKGKVKVVILILTAEVLREVRFPERQHRELWHDTTRRLCSRAASDGSSVWPSAAPMPGRELHPTSCRSLSFWKVPSAPFSAFYLTANAYPPRSQKGTQSWGSPTGSQTDPSSRLNPALCEAQARIQTQGCQLPPVSCGVSLRGHRR